LSTPKKTATKQTAISWTTFVFKS